MICDFLYASTCLQCVIYNSTIMMRMAVGSASISGWKHYFLHIAAIYRVI